jgi:hypothetical protein
MSQAREEVELSTTKVAPCATLCGCLTRLLTTFSKVVVVHMQGLERPHSEGCGGWQIEITNLVVPLSSLSDPGNVDEHFTLHVA